MMTGKVRGGRLRSLKVSLINNSTYVTPLLSRILNSTPYIDSNYVVHGEKEQGGRNVEG